MSASNDVIIRSDAITAVILPDTGARLHAIRAHGHDLLRTPDDPGVHRDDPFSWGAYPMAPWSNRAWPGRLNVAGRIVDLPPNFPDGSAIHGLVGTVPWQVDDDGALRVEAGGDGRWPWRFELGLTASVTGATLNLGYRLTNRSDASMPAGLGLHPWFRAPLELRLPADRVYPTNTDSPVHPTPVTGRTDLRRRAVPPPDLDATWTDLTEPVVELAWPELGLRARLESETSPLLIALASPGGTDAVAVEAQTHGPDALRRLAAAEPDPPALLEPGEALRLDLRLTVRLAHDLRGASAA